MAAQRKRCYIGGRIEGIHPLEETVPVIAWAFVNKITAVSAYFIAHQLYLRPSTHIAGVVKGGVVHHLIKIVGCRHYLAAQRYNFQPAFFAGSEYAQQHD